MSGARERLIELYSAAVAGANVEALTADAVADIPLERRSRVWLFSFGKAASGMADAAFTALKRGLAEVAGGAVELDQSLTRAAHGGEETPAA